MALWPYIVVPQIPHIVFEVQLHKHSTEQDNPFTWLASRALPDKLQDTDALLAARARWWFIFNLQSTRNLRSLSTRMLSSLSSPSLYTYWVLPHHSCRIFAPVKPHKISDCSALQFFEISLKVAPLLWRKSAAHSSLMLSTKNYIVCFHV